MKSRENSEIDCVSIIVPTYNSAKTLPTCLEALRAQKYQCKEVLVVDNYSKDETRNIAETFGACVILHKGTQPSATNLALTRSMGEYVFFLDSDQKLDQGVIENCVSLCSKSAIEAVKVPEVFVGLNFWGKCSALWKNSLVSAWGRKGGIPRFYKKTILLKQAARNEKLSWWEDAELYERLKSVGLKEAWCTSQVIHYETDSPKKAARKYLAYGQSISGFRDTHAKAPYKATFSIALSTVVQLLRNSGRSLSLFFGCLFLVTVKGFSATLGLLSRMR